jgi:integrase
VGGHALDEAVFVDQREVEKHEQKHFEQAIGQLERFVDDKVLVSRREHASISEKLRSARDRRDEVVGSTARDRVEAEIVRLPHFCIYDLRSTYATRLSAGGVADEWVTQLLRQGDAKMFKKYSQMKREALQKLNRAANESAGVLGQAG